MVKSAQAAAFQLGFNLAQVKDALLSIRRSNFSKSESDWHNQGQWQDAYKLCYEGVYLYIKWKVIEMDDDCLLVLSFKENTDYGV
jgi:hypothetical protein